MADEIETEMKTEKETEEEAERQEKGYIIYSVYWN